jgi:hypothetical protein
LDTHDTVLVNYGNKEAQIDIELAPIILWLWEQGIETTFCCQGGEGQCGYISFPIGDHASRFVRTLISLGFPKHKIKGLPHIPSFQWKWECKCEEDGNFSFCFRFPNESVAEINDLLHLTKEKIK